MIGEGFARALSALIVTIAGVAFGLGALMVWGLPKLWHVLKPWLHYITG